jgi:flagellar motor switch protein FliN/FliY
MLSVADVTVPETSDLSIEDGSVGRSSAPQLQPFQLADLTVASQTTPTEPTELLHEVELDLRIELGRTRMRLEDVLQLRAGSVVVLDNAADDPVDIYVNDRLIGRGEVLVMNDCFCVRITELTGV